MKISIIIPVYNAEKYIKRLLETIIKQTYKDYEVILINDGSNDNTLEEIEKFSNKDNKIKCRTIKNSGPGVARRKGFEEADGELLFFLDSDDYLPNDSVLAKIVKLYKENKFDILFFNFIKKYKDEEIITNSFGMNNMKEKKYNREYLYKHNITGALWCKVFVKSKMKREYFCAYDNYEDYYATYKYLENCDSFYYTKDVLYYADKDNNDSISKKVNSKKIENTVEVLKKIYEDSTFKDAVAIIMYDYYITIRRRIDKGKYDFQEGYNDIKKIKELKSYFNLIKLLKMKQSFRKIMIYIYYIIKDMIFRS